MRLIGIVASVVMLGAGALGASPAWAGRTVIDGGFSLSPSGYCSPTVAASPGGCPSTALASPITIGGQTYSRVYVNSNGTVSFNSIEATLAQQNSFSPTSPVYTGPPPATSLAAYPGPIFSPNFVDGPGFAIGGIFGPLTGFDGQFASTTSLVGNALTVSFFTCDRTDRCGQISIDTVERATFDRNAPITRFILGNGSDPFSATREEFEGKKANLLAQFRNGLPIYTLVITGLDDGFTVDYRYSPAALRFTGTSGFNLPSGLNETTGPLTDRSYRFDLLGQLVPSAVPEPATWLTMLLGFGFIGAALRRRKAVPQPA